MVKFIRKLECNRCGQCCGAEDGVGWPVGLQRYLESLSLDETGIDPVPLTKEKVEELMPVIALIGLPVHTGVNQGTVELSGRKFPYRWLENGRLVAEGTDQQCPYLYYHKENGPWLCGLVDSEEHWRWKKQCANWPKRIMMNEVSIRRYHETYPKCSYRWRRVD